MLGVFKKMFRKSATPEPAAPPVAAEANWGVSQGEAPDSVATEDEGQGSSGEFVVIKLSAIWRQLPQELQGKNSPGSSAKFSIDLDRVVDQLAYGTVRVPFKELRRAAPVGVFSPNHAHDDKLIELPLREIVPQLRPEYFSRRSQRRLEAPDEGTDLFNRTGRPLGPVRVIAKDELLRAEPAQRAAAAPEPEETPELVVPAAPITFSRRPTAQHPAAARPMTPQPAARPAVQQPIPPRPAAQQPAPRTPAQQPAARIPAPSIPAPSIPAPTIPASSIRAPRSPEESLEVLLEQIYQQWPEAVREAIESWAVEGTQCFLPMSSVGTALKAGAVRFTWKDLRGWIDPAPPQPDGVPVETVLDLPLKVIAPAYMAKARGASQQRKVEVAESIPDVFSMQGVAEVPEAAEDMEPVTEGMAEEVAEDNGEPRPFLVVPLSLLSQKWPDALRKEITLLRLTDAKVELPLETLEGALKAGRFECYWKQVCHWLRPCPTAALASVHAEVRLDMPLNLLAPFYLQQRPDAQAAAQAERASGAAPVEAPAARNLAELFGEPDKRNWTPNEIVHKTSQLPGVAGALMALQDGLLVASCMPPEWKSETIAAFLPQIFGRMKQYSKELKMGELESITFTVEQGTFQIYNVGIIYFAILAKPTAALPKESLRLIVRELARHTR
jgi:predicted regulator of Ras-like GTPase activity (Roadblock/LC7/MglB family)